MILVEKLDGITPEDESKFYQMVDNDHINEAFDFILKKLESSYKNQLNHINSGKKEYNYLHDFLISLVDDGFNPASNRLLELALDTRNNLDIPRDVVLLIVTCMNNGTLKGTLPRWIYDTKVYQGIQGNDLIFKIKALIFLSSSGAKKYGTNPEDAINNLIEAKSADQVERIVKDWQTRTPQSKQSTIRTPRVVRARTSNIK